MSKLLPYETIVKAHEGDPDAIDTVLSHYAGYIKFFDEQYFGQYQIVGFEYASEKYGVARIHVSEDPKVEEIRTADQMLRRAEKVWNYPMSADGEDIYTFLCANEELDSILWIEEDHKSSFTVEHYPSVINIVHNPGYAEYYLLDKNGNELR